MQSISYKGWVLFEGVVNGPSGLSLSYQRTLQKSGAFRAKEAKIFNRGNSTTTVQFSIEREHESIDDAIEFYLTHAGEAPDDDVEGELIFTYPNGNQKHLVGAELESINMPEPEGVSTVTTYSFVGQRMIN